MSKTVSKFYCIFNQYSQGNFVILAYYQSIHLSSHLYPSSFFHLLSIYGEGECPIVCTVRDTVVLTLPHPWQSLTELLPPPLILVDPGFEAFLKYLPSSRC